MSEQWKGDFWFARRHGGGEWEAFVKKEIDLRTAICRVLEESRDDETWDDGAFQMSVMTTERYLRILVVCAAAITAMWVVFGLTAAGLTSCLCLPVLAAARAMWRRGE